MPGDANAIFMDKTDLDSGTDGTGSGSSPTASGGAVLNLEEEGEVAVTLFIGQSDTGGEPGDADTLDVIVECAPDGTNYGRLFTFRRILGIEAPDDEAAGDKTLRLACIVKLPKSTQAGIRTVPCRLNTTANDTSNWSVYSDVRAAQDVREEWLMNAVEA